MQTPDVYCPYCDEGQDINHDDGYGYGEDDIHQQFCGYCEKVFTFQTSISFYYSVEKADCLNGADHIMRPTITIPVSFTKMECRVCGYSRNPTKGELAHIIRERG